MKILGGPALRRTDNKQVFIWLVLDRQANTITASLSTDQDSNNLASCTQASKTPIRLGEKLYVYLLKLIPMSGSFPKEIKLYYNIIVDGQGLSDFGLLSGQTSIVYPQERLPSFFIPKSHRHLLYGSCRKPHASTRKGSQCDQTLIGDRLLSGTVSNLFTRPSIYLLTGDQIYADDVSYPLAAALKKQALTFIGDESLPGMKESTIYPSVIPLGNRGLILRPQATGFTSGRRHNHLMAFGEYMAMYLAVFGGLMINLPTYDQTKNVIRKTRFGKKRINKKDYEKQSNNVAAFLSEAWHMRRLMANIPTYMMFDDHEVTDDWNLDQHIESKLHTVPLSRRIVSHALCAYWVCQGWGNDPNSFSKQFISSVKDYCDDPLSEKQAHRFDTVLHDQYWTYVVEGFPAIISLDTRTQRRFSKKFPMPGLLNGSKLSDVDSIIERLNTKYREDARRQTYIILSPAPVYGFLALEYLQGMAAHLLQALKKTNLIDAESWSGDRATFRKLKLVLRSLGPRNCVVLSGDVHYAYCRRDIIQRQDDDLMVYQLTSSALHNHPKGWGGAALRILAEIERQQVQQLKSRLRSPYLRPVEADKNHINHHTNIGLLMLEDGVPTKNLFFCAVPENQKQYTWTYNLVSPDIVTY